MSARNLFVLSVHIVQVPHVDRTEYQLIDITEDGFVRLLPLQQPGISVILSGLV